MKYSQKAPALNLKGIAPAPLPNVLTTAGYFERHFQLCLAEKSQYDAYEKVEEEYVARAAFVGLSRKTKYTSYESFRKAKSNYYNG